jgi:streptogramin lyase
MVTLPRRRLLALGSSAGLCGLAGCAAPAGEPQRPAAAGTPLRWRTLQGGRLSAPAPAGNMLVRWLSPGPLALRGLELLVADRSPARLWRADLAADLVTAVAGAPVGPGTALALGPDLAAWVLDPAARRVLRFARDGRLLDSRPVDLSLPSPVGLVLADGGATLLLADGQGAQWSEQRGSRDFVRVVAPEREGGRRISGVDALAPGQRGLWVLDRLAGAVHEVTRDGRVLRSLGQGTLAQPVALAVDRLDRVYVHDAQDHSIHRLAADSPAQRWTAAMLGVQQIGGLAVDGLTMALSDPLSGAVLLYTLAAGALP